MKSTADIGRKLKELREASHFTQVQIAEYLSVDQSMVSKIEKGERVLSSDMLEKLCALFCCSPASLVEEGSCDRHVVAFRSKSPETSDLFSLAILNRIVLHQFEMDELAKGWDVDGSHGIE